MTITLLPVPAQRLSHRPYMVLAGLQVADVFLTGLILTLFTAASEGNPIARWFTDHGLFGLAVLLVFKLGVVGLFWWCQTKVRIASGIYGIVVVNNLLVLVLLLGGWR